MTAAENVTDGTLVTLHGLHKVRHSVQNLDSGKDWVVTDFHEADLTIDLVEREQVISVRLIYEVSSLLECLMFVID